LRHQSRQDARSAGVAASVSLSRSMFHSVTSKLVTPRQTARTTHSMTSRLGRALIARQFRVGIVPSRRRMARGTLFRGPPKVDSVTPRTNLDVHLVRSLAWLLKEGSGKGGSTQRESRTSNSRGSAQRMRFGSPVSRPAAATRPRRSERAPADDDPPRRDRRRRACAGRL